jgi:hypothetical protein
VSYPALKGGASYFIVPPCLLNPKEGRGWNLTGYHGWHPPLFKREALRSRFKVKPHWGQRNTRCSSVKPMLILPQRKHSRELLYTETGKTSFSLFTNCHSSTVLKKRSRGAEASSFYFRSSGSNPGRLSPLALTHRTPV